MPAAGAEDGHTFLSQSLDGGGQPIGRHHLADGGTSQHTLDSTGEGDI